MTVSRLSSLLSTLMARLIGVWGRAPFSHPGGYAIAYLHVLSALMQIADRQTYRQAGRAGDKNVGHGEIRPASKSPQDTGAAGGQLCISRAQRWRHRSNGSPAAAAHQPRNLAIVTAGWPSVDPCRLTRS